MPSRAQKGEGFPGQRIVVLPRKVVSSSLRQPLIGELMATDVGIFPEASGHLRERSSGIDQAIFIYCARGEGWCDLAGERHSIRAGDLLVLPPETPHAYGANEKRPWTIPWVHAAGRKVALYLRELGVSSGKPVIYLGQDAEVSTLFEELLRVYENGYTPSHLLYASQILSHLIGLIIWRRQHAWRGEPHPQQKIAQSVDYMKQHLDRSLDVRALAALVNLSSSHYTALFRRQTGFAPIDYLIRLRMHRACQLLDNTRLSIKEVASNLGYDDPFYFSRLFKSVNETSPRDYRRTHKG